MGNFLEELGKKLENLDEILQDIDNPARIVGDNCENVFGSREAKNAAYESIANDEFAERNPNYASPHEYNNDDMQRVKDLADGENCKSKFARLAVEDAKEVILSDGISDREDRNIEREYREAARETPHRKI